MKKFILRFPTSERSKMIGGLLLDTAETTIKIADKFCRDENGTYTEDGILMIQKAAKLMNSAAREFGFRSIEELIEYNRRQKTG